MAQNPCCVHPAHSILCGCVSGVVGCVSLGTRLCAMQVEEGLCGLLCSVDCCAVWYGVGAYGCLFTRHNWVDFSFKKPLFSWQGRQVCGSLAGGLFIYVHVQTAYVLDGVWSVFWCVNVSCASQQGAPPPVLMPSTCLCFLSVDAWSNMGLGEGLSHA
jgi:hypothetical protein